MKFALLIPCYEPDKNSLEFLSSFSIDDFDYFLLINDGSDVSYYPTLDAIRKNSPFKIIGYKGNKGKGFALRHGIDYLRKAHKDIDYIITADSDGQHLRKDILLVRDEAAKDGSSLVLGSRNLLDAPRKSKIGNKISASRFKLLTKKSLKDTQTGLRAIPKSLFPLCLSTLGNRYEYEYNFLLDAAKQIPIKEVGIETIYFDNNKNTHYRPIVDSFLLYKSPILYIFASILSWVLDLGAFYLLSTFVFTSNAEMQVYLSTLLARIFSGFFNFLLLYLYVFDRREGFARKGVRYLILFIINLTLSASLTYAFKFIPANLTFIKFGVDVILAIANYFVNRIFVFSRKKKKEGGKEKMIA